MRHDDNPAAATPPTSPAAPTPAGPPRFSSAWRTYGLIWLATVAALLVLFRADVMTMVAKWENDETFGHAYMILPIALWLVWMRRHELAQVEPRPWAWGLVAVAGSMALWVIGHLARVAFVEQFAVLFVIQSSILTILGLNVTRTLLFPIAYLLFMVPFGDQIVPQMQDFTAHFSVQMLHLLEIPVYHDGIFISIPTGDFEVAVACSGVRFIIAMVAVGSLYANLAFRSPWRRALLMVVSVIVPIIANGFRAFGIIYIAYKTDNEYAVGVDHIVYGWVFFSIVMMAVLLIGRTFSDRWIDEPAVDVAALGLNRGGAGTPAQAARALALLAMVVGAGATYAYWIDHRQADVRYSGLAAPSPAGWTPATFAGTEWKPVFNGANAELFQSYRNGDARVDLYVAAFDRQHDDVELIAFGQTAVAPAELWTRAMDQARTLTIGGRTTTGAVMQINRSRTIVRDVWQWYWVNGKLIADPYVAKIETLKAKLFGGDMTAATIIISAERREATVPATAEMQHFADALGPVEPALASILKSGARPQ
ncbi:exosortase A [Parapedomonas caeni]